MYEKRVTEDLTIIIHGGWMEIGGNIIEIRYKGESLVFDMGLNIARKSDFYEWPFMKHRGIDELTRLGVAPIVDGLYTKWDDEGKKPDLEYGRDTSILGVFISHAHIDHIGLLSQVNRNIPVYLGDTTRLIHELNKEVRRKERWSNYEGINYEVFRHGDVKNIDPFRIRPLHVDHSVPGAYSFFIETPDGTILYTGDFRSHGQSMSLTQDMVDAVADEEVNLMITEGTRVQNVSTLTEEDVYIKMKEIFQSFHGEILIEMSKLDVDRFKSIIRASSETGRKIFLVEEHLMNLLNYYVNDEKLRNRLDEAGFNSDTITGLNREGRNSAKRNKILELAEGASIELVDRYQPNPNQVVVGFYSIIQEIASSENIPRLAILSNSEPFKEEGEISQNRLFNWLNTLNTPSYRIHCSGHISPLDLKKIYEEVSPRDIMIIHSEHPDAVMKFIRGF